ncbi:MAG: sulfatase-like hydrolase/transferase [Vicinamibacteria bacterium]
MIVRLCLACLGFAAFLFCAACGKGPAPADKAGPTPRPSVVLISIDTLRADHVGVRGLTPALDALAKRGLRFTSAWSQVPLTLPSHSSMLTGLLPTHHGVRDNVGYELRGRETLAERFRKAGFATGGFVSATVLRRETGIARGFEVFDDEMPSTPGKPGLERGGPLTVERALNFVDLHKTEGFFLFVHLYEPHTPYEAPARFQDRGASSYDHEVAAADDAVGALMAGLTARGVDRPLVVVTSDHGEGLGDHGEAEHGLLLYAEALHVPLILVRPDGRGAGAEVSATVREVDIASTLLRLAGLDADGTDGAPLDESPGSLSRPAYSETWYPRIHFAWSELASATEGRWRFIDGPSPEFYDLKNDPREKSSLALDPTRPAAAMARFIAEQKQTASPQATGETSRDAEERLRSLGYLGSRGFARASSGANPRDKISFYQPFMTAFTGAFEAHGSGNLTLAAEQYRKAISLVATEKGLVVPKLHSGLGDALARLGQTGAAENEFKAELRLDPASVEGRTGLGTLLWSLGRDAEAREVIGGIVTRSPKAGAAEYAAVIRAFEILDDAASLAVWRDRARSLGYPR